MALLRRFNPSIHHRRSIRLKGYDYSSPGYYFITFCTINRERLFGEIENGIMKLNPFGKVVEFTWMDLPNHNPSISLDAFVVMPDHVHGIIIIKNVNKIDTIDEGDDDSVGAGSEPTPTRMIRQIKTRNDSMLYRKSYVN